MEKQTTEGPLKPQKVGFRARGSAIRPNPTNLQKVTKSLPKRLPHGMEIDEKRIKKPSGTPLKKKRAKGAKKPGVLYKNLVVYTKHLPLGTCIYVDSYTQ